VNVRRLYDVLFAAYGPQYWWPADTPFEVMIGAILTQNTAWTNVEKAIENLKSSGALKSPSAMSRFSTKKIARLIKPAGYYNVKAKRIHNFLAFLDRSCGLKLERLSQKTTAELRKSLLDVNGIGPETADSMLLYAFGRPVFVVDAYAKRVFSRHGMIRTGVSYEAVQEICMNSLPADVRLYNEYHALIVRLGKDFCRPTPKCELCPLAGTK